jgi:hypothetical protein
MILRFGNMAALLAAGMTAMPPPALAGGACYSGAAQAGYSYSGYAPSYSYAPSYGYQQQATYYQPQVIVQQALVPAYVLQAPKYSFQYVAQPKAAAPAKLDDAAMEAIAEKVVLKIAPALTAATVTTPAPLTPVGWGLDDDEPLAAPQSARQAPPLPSKGPPIHAAPLPPSASSQSRAPTGRGGFSQAEVEALGGACYKCHNPAKPGGKLSLFDERGAWAPRYADGRPVDPVTIVEAATSPDGVTPPAMPKGATADRSTWLGPTALAALERWAIGEGR